MVQAFLALLHEQLATPAGWAGIAALALQSWVLIDHQQRLLLWGTAGSLGLWALHFGLLGAEPIAAMIALSMSWYLLCSFWRPWRWMTVVMLAIQFPLAFAIESSWVAFFSALGSVFFLSAPAFPAGLTRRAAMAGGQVCFGTNAILVGSLWALISDGVQVSANLLGAIRERRTEGASTQSQVSGSTS